MDESCSASEELDGISDNTGIGWAGGAVRWPIASSRRGSIFAHSAILHVLSHRKMQEC
jgi:hypothetical protein